MSDITSFRYGRPEVFNRSNAAATSSRQAVEGSAAKASAQPKQRKEKAASANAFTACRPHGLGMIARSPGRNEVRARHWTDRSCSDGPLKSHWLHCHRNSDR